MASKNLMQMSTDIVKLDRFDGGSFKRWQKKMQFLLATLKVAYVLSKPYPKESEDETLVASHSRPIMDQMYELEHILSMFTQNNMNMDESIQVASIIDKLPSTWKDVKKNLKHHKDDLSLKDLGKHLLIEEQYRLENKTNDDTSKVHVVEEKGESPKACRKKHRHDDKDKKKFKKNKKDVICYNCKKPRHFKRECRTLKKK
ncbi:zinc finger, CCHC-type containing protein [Tanacetum coccineum]